VGSTEEQPAGTAPVGATKKHDILGAKLMELDWTDRRAAVQAIIEEVRTKSVESEDWYRVKKDAKRKWAVFLRVTAIVCGILSALWPVLFNALAVIWPKPAFSSSPDAFTFKDMLPLSAVFVILATGCVTIDSFFGFSSGWIRYVITFQSLQSLRETFELSWPRAAVRFPAKGDIPDDVLLSAIDVLLAFTKSINDTIRDETQAWAADFREALKGMGESLEKQRMAAMGYANIAERGSLTITLVGADKLDDHRWTLSVSGQPDNEVHGSSTEVVERLPPGLVTLRASGRRDDKLLKTAAAVNVEAGKNIAVSLTLG